MCIGWFLGSITPFQKTVRNEIDFDGGIPMPHLAAPEHSTRSGLEPKSKAPWPPLLVLLAIALIALAVAWSDTLPAPLGLETPANVFSAARALAVLNGLAGRGEPRLRVRPLRRASDP